jgi:hypothetical protein
MLLNWLEKHGGSHQGAGRIKKRKNEQYFHETQNDTVFFLRILMGKRSENVMP